MLERIKARGVLFLCYIMYFDVPVSYDYKRGYHLANIHNRLYSLYYLGMLQLLQGKKTKSKITLTEAQEFSNQSQTIHKTMNIIET